MKTKLNKRYVSELDEFLTELNQRFPKPSDSQRAEEVKYARVFKLRDEPMRDNVKQEIWEKF